MEQVDRLDDISLEELAEGTVAQGCSDFGSPSHFTSHPSFRDRAPRVLTEIRRAIL